VDDKREQLYILVGRLVSLRYALEMLRDAAATHLPYQRKQHLVEIISEIEEEVETDEKALQAEKD
jgi:hypothetical protein